MFISHGIPSARAPHPGDDASHGPQTALLVSGQAYVYLDFLVATVRGQKNQVKYILMFYLAQYTPNTAIHYQYKNTLKALASVH